MYNLFNRYRFGSIPVQWPFLSTTTIVPIAKQNANKMNATKSSILKRKVTIIYSYQWWNTAGQEWQRLPAIPAKQVPWLNLFLFSGWISFSGGIFFVNLSVGPGFASGRFYFSIILSGYIWSGYGRICAPKRQQKADVNLGIKGCFRIQCQTTIGFSRKTCSIFNNIILSKIQYVCLPSVSAIWK